MRFLLALAVLLGVVGCSNDFEISDSKRETPVVYGVLDPSQEFQYIKVERVFQAAGLDANDVAALVDSLYYDELEVSLTNESNGQSVTCVRVDGSDEGLPRDTGGVFAVVPNYLYKASLEDLDAKIGDKIMLSIAGIYDDKAVTASTVLIDRPGASDPINDSALDFIVDKFRAFRWSAREGTELYTAVFYIDVIELRDGMTELKTVEWVIAESTTETEAIVEGVEFYQFMGGAFEADPDVQRFVDDIRYSLTAGNSDIATIGNIAAANLGITSSGEVPVFTNLSEGLGLFAAKNTYRATNISLAGDTRETLRESPFTRDLNF